MDRVENLGVSKEKILSTIQRHGPSLPVQIARAIEFSPLFTSAFLSELKGEGKVAISNMRVGSSPLYYLPGQEGQLEKFTPYLNQREREAFQLLREKKVLEDSEQNPIIRVALRAIKDFAFPVKVRVNGDSKLFWRYYSLSDDEVAEFASKGALKAEPKAEESVVEEVKEPVKEEVVEEVEAKSEQVSRALKEEVKKDYRKELEEERPLAEKRQAKSKESEFGINVKDHLQTKDIEVLEVLMEKKKELEAKVRVDALFGKQDFYLIAKDKGSTTDNDLAMAFQKAQNERMPALVMSTGELNKKGKTHLEQWGNLVKFEKLEF